MSGSEAVGLLGAGVMGEALLAAVLRVVPADRVLVSEANPERAAAVAAKHGVRADATPAEVAAASDVLVVALKPKDVPAVLASIAPALRPGALVVSVAAGLSTATLAAPLPEGTAVVRVMPNTPAVVGKGAAAICPGAYATTAHLDTVQQLLAPTGLVVRVGEADMDAVTAISGSGPAYVFYLVDALAEAGVLLGLTRAQAMDLARATFLGAAELLEQTGEHPVVLRERVSSPGGTTVAGLRALDAHGVRAAVIAAAEAARDRSRELGAPPASSGRD
ncbi:pyrroline-5-carboxylate reductase [Actinotalea sp. M2MS4P-6]|uniref:pyrroline-5-carboxylate reductase n=1 Tax=Actinotalea sp. M2MS4P-6 TaxID=2983762 RepID=UPI0021E4422A|nr:pyrroline-5-carboxylate reductase [Actinotalea sp. M2MS4P-6]MCV2393242.1 pyrroline-5-carboxylate reductase [Actinotalea sp. M2MS4P-6]